MPKWKTRAVYTASKKREYSNPQYSGAAASNSNNEPSGLKTIIGVVFIIGVLFLAAYLFRKTYTPANKETAASQFMLPPGKLRSALTCTVVVSDVMRNNGREIPGLNIGAAPSALSLLRPVGEMLSDSLVATARNCFRDVRLVSRTTDAQGSDLIVELVNWRFGHHGGETGYNFTGLPLLLAGGEACTTIHVEVRVNGEKIPTFTLNETAKGIHQLGLVLFPVSRLSRSMTESSDLAAAIVSAKIFDQIIRDSRVSQKWGRTF